MRFRRRTLAVCALAASTLFTAACQPSAPQDAETSGGAGLGTFSDAVPADYDWHLTLHGGSGDLTFGDGDWAEGERVLQLSCLPRSGRVEITWPGEEQAVLTAGTATETFVHASRVPTGHPVLAALKDTGAISVGLGETDLRLTAEASGRRQLADFFAYCDDGREPRAAVEPPVPSETVPEEIVEAEADAETPIATPTAPAGEEGSGPEARAPADDPKPRPATPQPAPEPTDRP